MTTQVRIYEVWRRQVVLAWASSEDDTVVWIISHPGDFAEADRAYYESPQRAALDPDPARHIAEQRSFLARPIAP